ncbi:MAG TPA: hypothetical protein VGD14_18160 [bacterium]
MLGTIIKREMQEYLRSFKFLIGKSASILFPQLEEFQSHKARFRRFEESQPSIFRSLKNALLDLSDIILWNLVLSVLSFAAFIRSDVR